MGGETDQRGTSRGRGSGRACGRRPTNPRSGRGGRGGKGSSRTLWEEGELQLGDGWVTWVGGGVLLTSLCYELR